MVTETDCCARGRKFAAHNKYLYNMYVVWKIVFYGIPDARISSYEGSTIMV